MTLDPPTAGILWKEYRIDTPTFELSPVEKPDMSPYLVHMTGRDAIAKILAGEGSPDPLPDGTGFLMAVVPVYEGFNQLFSRPVVCFSESPLFALDFFRYRSFRRWQDDQRFGIGFNKSNLAERGVRPVVYLDGEIRSHLRSLQTRGEISAWKLASLSEVNVQLRALVEGLAPLVFPLLEDHDYQGFMWEREWRATSAEGFAFSHEDIEIICCPPKEEQAIREALGPVADDIKFIRTWLEYDDVTSFLQEREELRVPYVPIAAPGSSLSEQIAMLEQQRSLHDVAIHSLEGFVALSDQIASRGDMARRELGALKDKKTTIEQELTRVRSEKAQKDEADRPARSTDHKHLRSRNP